MTSALVDSTSLPTAVTEILEAYARTHRDAEVALWARRHGAWRRLFPDDGALEPALDCTVSVGASPDGDLLLEVLSADGSTGEQTFFVQALRRMLLYEQEARSAAHELSERYEEINLLYSISEILASVMSLGVAARKILEEVVDVLGARRAAVWLYEEEAHQLTLTAAVGEGGRGPIDVYDPISITARVFRERQPVNLEQAPGTEVSTEPLPRAREAYLSVPLNFTPPDGGMRTIGVITLVGRRTGVRFTAGDMRLLMAVASQVGAALETHRLVQQSLRRERVEHEMELAHDLQLKLLPDTGQFAGTAKVAARCAPAESVGGDFYNLFHLSGGRLGVVIGDVSSHGFSAALIMALTMSAIAIYAQESDPPGEVLRRVHAALIDELESTEMYLSLVYAIIDPDAGRMSYANAGHPHAFRVAGDGEVHRLESTSPPLGTAPVPVTEGSTEWKNGEDLLVLFTDGLSDAFPGGFGIMGERALLDEVVRRRTWQPRRILAWLFAETENAELNIPPDDRSAVLVRT
ncbi:MAG: SpoIIE family protein phosphatase [Gemmatimonadota bacterium]|jgi:sigma-B regulation protein RsbU (phosphoserine phosphatase)